MQVDEVVASGAAPKRLMIVLDDETIRAKATLNIFEIPILRHRDGGNQEFHEVN